MVMWLAVRRMHAWPEWAMGGSLRPLAGDRCTLVSAGVRVSRQRAALGSRVEARGGVAPAADVTAVCERKTTEPCN
jgi:hypothetical protein